MQNAISEALAIYETICATSKDRPFNFQTREQMIRELAAWKAANPGLQSIAKASPDVLRAFLAESAAWLKAESQVHGNFRVSHGLQEAVAYALEAVPKPLPPELVVGTLEEIRKDFMAHHTFPLYQFLSTLNRDDVTDEIRAQLRKLQFFYLPSPRGQSMLERRA